MPSTEVLLYWGGSWEPGVSQTPSLLVNLKCKSGNLKRAGEKPSGPLKSTKISKSKEPEVG